MRGDKRSEVVHPGIAGCDAEGSGVRRPRSLIDAYAAPLLRSDANVTPPSTNDYALLGSGPCRRLSRVTSPASPGARSSSRFTVACRASLRDTRSCCGY
jgi:hypothetical protein